MATLRPTRSGPSAAQHLLALALFLALTLLYFRPPLSGLDRHIAPNAGDPVFNLWVLEWGAHQLRLGFPDLWQAPIFYPTTRAFAFSDTLLGPAAATAALAALGLNAIAAYNLLLLGSFALCGWSAWYVLARSGLPPAAALFGAMAWAFSSSRWEQLSHLQVILAAAIPLVLWLWDRLLVAPTWRRAGLFLLVYAAHLSGGAYLAYMVHAPLAVLLLNRLPELRRDAVRGRSAWVLAATTAAAAACAAAAFLPYWLAWRGGGPPRTPDELRQWGASLVSYVTPVDLNFYSPLWPWPLRRDENALFAGFLPTAFAVAGAAALRRRRPAAERPSRGRRAALAACLGLALAGWGLGELHTWSVRPGLEPLDGLVSGSDNDVPFLLLAAGTAGWLLLRRRWRLGWSWQGPLPGLDPDQVRWWRGLLLGGLACLLLSHPIVFAMAAKLAPGLGGMRVPARFHVFASFAVAALAAAGVARLLAARPSAGARRRAAALVLVVLAVELTPIGVDWLPLPRQQEFAPVYSWLAGRRDVQALLELPWTDPGAQYPAGRDIRIMYFGTRHWRPLVNGYSGYFPEHYSWLRARCCWPVPDGEALAALRRWGVSHVLIHRRPLWHRWQRRAIREWERTAGVRRVYTDKRDTVYEISPRAKRQALRQPATPRDAGRASSIRS